MSAVPVVVSVVPAIPAVMSPIVTGCEMSSPEVSAAPKMASASDMAAAKTATVPQYSSGSWGPSESDALLERDGRKWYTP